MLMLRDHPFLGALVTLVAMWGAAQIGVHALSKVRHLDEGERGDFGFIVGATLTLLGLIIGFSFSMAIGRYDQRKNYEEEEANAIGTEYVRVELLPPADAQKLQEMLKDYLRLRIEFYRINDRDRLPGIDAATAQSQNDMWAAVKSAAAPQPNPLMALVVSGMNDVLNRQGYTQAAWWNRIPFAAWELMILIALCCNVMLGFGARGEGSRNILLLILPVVLSISFLLLADLDSPRGGIIRVHPQNLESLAQSLNVH